MKKILLLIFIGLVASPFLSNSEIQDNRSTIILNKLSKTYKTYKSVKANFKIKIDKKNGGNGYNKRWPIYCKRIKM